jgi:hypothetical protein
MAILCRGMCHENSYILPKHWCRSAIENITHGTALRETSVQKNDTREKNTGRCI